MPPGPARSSSSRQNPSVTAEQSASNVSSADACPCVIPTEGSTHVRHRRLRRPSRRQAHHHRRPQTARVPRLRLGGHRPARGAGARRGARRRQPGLPGGGGRRGSHPLPSSASVTRAGRRTAGRPKRTRTRTSDCSGRSQIVLNGIIENYKELRAELSERATPSRARRTPKSWRISSKTHIGAGLTAAVRATIPQLDGHFAFCALSAGEPDLVVGTRSEAPLVVGVGDGEMFFASADPRLPRPHTPDRRAGGRRRRHAPGRRRGVHRRRRRAAARARRPRSAGTLTPPRRAASRRSC